MDNWGIDETKIKSRGCNVLPSYTLPELTWKKETIGVEIGRSITLSLEASIPGVSIGPTTTIEYTKKTEFSYTLGGKHTYVLYCTDGSLSYYWTAY